MEFFIERTSSDSRGPEDAKRDRIEIEDLDTLLALVQKEGQIIVSPPKTAWYYPDEDRRLFSLEIYDDWRE